MKQFTTFEATEKLCSTQGYFGCSADDKTFPFHPAFQNETTPKLFIYSPLPKYFQFTQI